MSSKKKTAVETKTVKDFEQKHGGSRIAALERALEAQATKRHPISLEIPCADNTITFGVIGDTQYGSCYEALDQAHALYELFSARGIKDVLHTGDVLDGHKVYRGQEFELHQHGWQRQRDWFADNAPKVAGVTTHFITGNHDHSMKKAAGIDVGGELSDRRPDWNFLGEDYAMAVFTTPNGRKVRVALVHPSGGSAYALSYRPQKIVEQIEGGTKPNLLCIGHYHKAEFMPAYRNVAVIQSGCLQWQTPFMVAKGLAAHVGGWIVRIAVQDKKILCNSIHVEFTAFYSTKD